MQLAAPDDLESKFRNLEGDDVDDQLAAMKKRSLTGATASSSKPEKQLPEGRPIRCACGCSWRYCVNLQLPMLS